MRVERFTSPNSRFFQTLDTFGVVRSGVEQVKELVPRPRENFSVITRIDSFQEAVNEVIERHDPRDGVLAFVVDLDKTFRAQRLWEHVLKLRLGIVRDEELAFGRKINDLEGVVMVVVSQQPRKGFQVARVLSLGGRRYKHPPDCFEEARIFYLGSHTRGPFYDGFKGKPYAPGEVAEVLEKACGIDQIGKLVVVGDKFGDVVFANKVHQHLAAERGYQGPCDAYWI